MILEKLLARFPHLRLRPTQVRADPDENSKRDKFAIWREKKNPQGTFKQFYAERAVEVIKAGKPHRTLGANVTPEGRQAARLLFDTLISLGLERSDGLVDYGCGTLRLGRLLIEYLDAGRYLGLDIDDRILRAGCEMLSVELITEKKPSFSVISTDRIHLAVRNKPQWIIATDVLHHVAPFEIDEFFHNISIVVRAGAIGFITCKKRSKVERLSTRSWGYNVEYLQGAAAGYGMTVQEIEGELRDVACLFRAALPIT
jgi:hypothetical protein